MARSALFCLVWWLLLAAVPARAADGVTVVETRTVSGESLTGTLVATHNLRLNVYTFEGARWQPGDIVVALWDAMRLLDQCGIALPGAELRVLAAPRQYHYYSTAVSRELLRGMEAAKPAIFFVEDTRQQPAYESETIGRGNAGTRPELTDTVWVVYGAQPLPLVLAHELVHLLSDSGEHSNEPDNLMREDAAPGNVRLTPAQCERLRTRGEANGLLRRR